MPACLSACLPAISLATRNRVEHWWACRGGYFPEQIFLEPGGRAIIDFLGEPSNHFAVSYRQCSEEDPQPLQLQYAEKLIYLPSPGGCIYVSLSLLMMVASVEAR